MTGSYQRPTNPWLAQARKFVISAAVAVVEIANVWAGGPDWLYAVAPVIGAALVYWVGNAPKYVGAPTTRS